MRIKRLFKIVLPLCCLSLSSCALFNDDDIKPNNHYEPDFGEHEEIPPGSTVAGGVVASENANAPYSLCFKNISYATDDYVTNTYRPGGVNYQGYTVNNGEDYHSPVSNNNYDLYVPNTAPRNDKHLVILFIHGGAWVSGFKTDVNPYIFEFANRGYITATIKYTLLHREMDDPTLSIFRNLDEIDACISSIKSVLEELDFDTSKTQLVIGGASSGAHLSMLYAYSRGKNAALPIKFIVDAVGPVDIKPSAWASFIDNSDEVLELGLTKSAIDAQVLNDNIGELEIQGEGGKRWTDYQTFRIANGMCGMPYTIEEVEQATDEDKNYITDPNNPAYLNMTAANGGENLLSVTYWIDKADNDSKFPIVCAYAGKDTVIGINQFATLQKALDHKGITYYNNSYIYFQNSEHDKLTREFDQVHYDELINAIATWCAAETI